MSDVIVQIKTPEIAKAEEKAALINTTIINALGSSDFSVEVTEQSKKELIVSGLPYREASEITIGLQSQFPCFSDALVTISGV